MDKASTLSHYKSRKVKDYPDQNKNTHTNILPSGSPEFMMLDEVWNIDK